MFWPQQSKCSLWHASLKHSRDTHQRVPQHSPKCTLLIRTMRSQSGPSVPHHGAKKEDLTRLDTKKEKREDDASIEQLAQRIYVLNAAGRIQERARSL